MPIAWPSNPEAEKMILGTIALFPEQIKKTRVQEADFNSGIHRGIFKAMLELDREGIPPDAGALLPKIGEEASLQVSQFMEQAVTAANLSYFEEIIIEEARKRSLQKACLDCIKGIGEAEGLSDLLGKLRSETDRILKSGSNGALVTSREIATELWDFVERRAQDKNGLSGIPTGLKDLNQLTDGWQAGDLIILAARPSKGKSALAMHFATAAAQAGIQVGIISLEMGSHQIGIRSMANLSNVELWRLRKGILSSQQFNDLAQACEVFSNLGMFFSFSSRDTRAISKTVAEMVEIHGCKLILLDYLQLTKSDSKKERREREIAEISWALKTAAQNHKIPVIALSQLNRDAEKQNRRPNLSDLRDSGAIEQDADVVFFLHQEGEKEPLEIIIAKGRNIGTGVVKVTFDRELMTFRDYSPKKNGEAK